MRPVRRCGRAQHRLLPEVGIQVVISRYRLGQRFPQYYRGRRFPRGRVPHFSRGELKSESFKYNEGLHDRQSVLITFRDRRKSFLICKRLDTAKEFSRRKLSFQPGSQVCVRTRITCGVAKFRRFLWIYAKHEVAKLREIHDLCHLSCTSREMSVSSGVDSRFSNSL